MFIYHNMKKSPKTRQKKVFGQTDQWQILLYYKYVPILLPQKFAYENLKLCKKLGLKGRIIVAKEGINGTVGGPKKATDRYMKIMREDKRFADMQFKISNGLAGTFQKIFVRARPELVTLALDKGKIDPRRHGGAYLKAEELKRMYDNDEDFVIVDMRNKYESAIGKFQNAITMDITVFKELPEAVSELEPYKNKKIVTYCTGGIRCEKASAFLKKRGFKDVYQLEGGIVKYGEKFPDDYWEGKLFVFDERMAIPINTPKNRKIIAKCRHCAAPWDDYINCANVKCNELFLCCDACRAKLADCCSFSCVKFVKNKKYHTSTPTIAAI